MFSRDSTLFRDAEPLDDSYWPDEIVERGEQLEKYKRALQPIVDNRPTSNLFIYGKTGVGKTVATRFILQQLERDIKQYDDVSMSYLWVGCENLSSSYQVAVQLVNQLRDQNDKSKIPPTGHSQQWVFDTLYTELDDVGGTVIIVLDEIDNIGHSDEILYGLPRARSNGYVEDANPVVIGISNDFKFRDDLGQKVKDTLAEKEILFPPYDASQLQTILQPRAEKAFRDGVLEGGVVPLCAALAAQDSGSARQAIRLLREAGELAQSNDEDAVKDEHVREAREELEKDQLLAGMSELTTHGHAILCSLTYYEVVGETPVRSREVYQKYTDIANSLDLEPVSERRARDHLSDLNMLGIGRVYERNKGPNSGRYYEYELSVPMASAISVLEDTGRFEDIGGRLSDKL